MILQLSPTLDIFGDTIMLPIVPVRNAVALLFATRQHTTSANRNIRQRFVASIPTIIASKLMCGACRRPSDQVKVNRPIRCMR
jgi:hypothetical protein